MKLTKQERRRTIRKYKAACDIIEAFDDMTQKCAITPNEHVFLVKQEHKHSYQIITTCLGCGQLFVQCIFTVTNF